MREALMSECIDLDEGLEVHVDTETYDSTIVQIRGEDGETLKEIEIIGSQEKGQDTIIDGEWVDE
jgi:hypothetical protein